MTVCSKCGGLKGDPLEMIGGTPCVCDDTRFANLNKELERITRGAQLTVEYLGRNDAIITHLRTQLTAHTQALKMADGVLRDCERRGSNLDLVAIRYCIDTINNLLK